VTVTVTLTCWVPGETGTGDGAATAAPLAAYGTGTIGVWPSLMLITRPSIRPAAVAYWAARSLASAMALARAVVSRPFELSLSASDTPSIRVALPP
jgi:hypothetical protein